MSSSATSLHAIFLSISLMLPIAASGASSPAERPQPPIKPASAPASHASAASQQIKGDARIVHVLNRLTFGPRPGDIAAVKAVGIEAWIEQQLQPEKIDDSALQAKLKMYPAMQMSLQELIQQLPPPPVIRQVINGRFPIPSNDPLKAVYQTQVALIEMREQTRATKQAEQISQSGKPPMGATKGAAATPDAMNDSFASQQGKRVSRSDPSLQAKEKQILADLQATAIVNLPPPQRMEKVLAMQPLERISFYRDLSQEDRLAFVQGLTPQQAQLFSAMLNPVRTVASQLEATKMLRVVYSDRQLQEVMTDFWLNHFNVDIRKSPLMAYYLTGYESKVLQPDALGNFEDLLVATARSPAMLLYLDNASSVGAHSQAALRLERGQNGPGAIQPKRPAPGLNENYGRELMELQTLGVNGGYTQQDVIEVAKAFTGWTIEKPLQGGGFVFNPRWHEPGTKHVLGHAIQEHGEDEGLEVLHILATSPATAHHISEELAERFVSDHPPQTLVDRMARTFLATHGNIRQVLRTMFFSPEFWERNTLNAKVKTPLELVASATRASGTQVEHPIVLALAVARLGMPLYDCQPPTGYSMNADAWVSSGSLVERMNFAMAFANNRLPGITNHWDMLLGADASSMEPSRKESRLEELLLQGNVSAHTHDAVMKELVDAPIQSQPRPFPVGGGFAQGYMVPVAQPIQPDPLQQPQPQDHQAAMTAGLLIGSPDFQSR